MPIGDALAAKLEALAGSPGLRARLGLAARRSVAAHTWEHALERLAGGYATVLAAAAAEVRDAA